MFFRKVKLRLKSKYAKLFMIIFFVSIIVIWLSFKGQLIYENVKYIGNYYDYYVDKYLYGNYNYLYLYGYSSIYIEEAFKYIFSSIIIYGITFFNEFYPYISTIGLIFIFYKVSKMYYDDIYNNASISKISRIDLKKYINHNLLTDGTFFGLIITIPKIIYLIFLVLGQPNGYPSTSITSSHIINTFTYAPLTDLYKLLNNNIFLVIGIDLFMSFLFGFLIFYLSLLIIFTVKNRTLSYFSFIGLIVALTQITSLLGFTPVIWYSSIFSCYYYHVKDFNLFIEPLILASYCLILFFICKILYKHSLRNNI